MQRHLIYLFLVVTAGAGLLLLLGYSEAFGGKHPLQRLPVTGRLADGGTFTGRLTVQELTTDDRGQLAATGVLTGTALSQTGTATKIPPRAFTTRAPLLDLRGTCSTLVLDLEPIFLDPLRQEVRLVPVTLDMRTIQKDERLLSTTLCALARLQE
jgi:hypothetical protein